MTVPLAWWPPVLVCFALSFFLVPLVRVYARRAGLSDAPGPRRSHAVPTPRGGGLAVVAGISVAFFWLPLPGIWSIGLLTSLLAIGALGFLDDHRPVPATLRLVVQMAIALWMLVWLGGVERLDLGYWSPQAPWLWNPLALLGLVWMINLHNFMDGSNGLAAAQGVSTGAFFALAFYWADLQLGAILALCVAVGYLGFLPWNLTRPGIFMGDVGSMALGLLVGMLILIGLLTGAVPVWISVLITSIFVVDATATLLNRMFTGGQWYTPHREHAYQRLIQAGWSHERVCFLYVALNWVVVLPALVVCLLRPGWAPAVIGVVVLTLIVAWFRVQGVARQ